MSGMELESNRLLSFAPTRSRRFGLPSHGAWPLAPTTFPALTPALLARAGWYFTPSKASPDQVTCFLCKKSLGGWEPTDDAFVEHVGHGRDCGWADTRCRVEVRRRAEGGEDDDEGKGVRWSLEAEGGTLPAEMEMARKTTFGKWWPHDKFKGWTPTSSAMAKAGFVFTPTAEAPDLATCLYCELGLDGWEPSDDPFQEHLKRTPKCPFFAAVGAASSSARPASASSSKPAAKGGKRPAAVSGKKRAPTPEPVEEETGEDDEDAFEMIDMPSPPAAKTPKPTRASRQSKAPSATTSTTTASRAGRTRTTTAPTPASSTSTAKSKAKPAKASSAAASKKEKPLPPSPERGASPTAPPEATDRSEDELAQERPASPSPEPAPKARKSTQAAKGKATAAAASRTAAPPATGDEASDEGAVDDGLDTEASAEREKAPRAKPVVAKKKAKVALAESKSKARGKKAAAVVDASEIEDDGHVDEDEHKTDVESPAPLNPPLPPPSNKPARERDVSGSSALTPLPSSSSSSANLIKPAPLPARPASSSSSIATSSAKPNSLGRPLTVRSPPPPAQLIRPRPMFPPAASTSASTSTPGAGTPSRLPVRSHLVSPRSPQQLHQQQQPLAPSFGQVASTAAAAFPAQSQDDVFSAPAVPAALKAGWGSPASPAEASSSRTGPVPAAEPAPVAPLAMDDGKADFEPDEEDEDEVEVVPAREPFDDEELDVQTWIQQAFRRRADEMAYEHERAKQAFLERALEARRLIEEESCGEIEGDDPGSEDE